jgi:hypothetical protein
VSKYTAAERTLVKSIVAALSIKRIPDSKIMKEHTHNQHTLTTLGNDRYDSLRMIDNAIKMHKKFHTNNNNILNDISFLY